MRLLVATAVAFVAMTATNLWPGESSGSTVLVQGLLLDAEGSPIAAAVLNVAVVDSSGRAFVEVRGTQLLSPTGATDPGGRFSVVVPLSFFASGAAFTVGFARPDAGLQPGVDRLPLVPALRNGLPVTFLYPAKRRVVELGEILAPLN